MIVNERIVTYLHSLEPGNLPYLEELEKYARENYVPIIRKEMESFLKVLIQMKQPQSILEVGTAIGYSALFMSECMPKDCHITTIENYEKRIPIAKDNFKKYKKEEKITLLEGDAMEILPKLQGKFDFIFMDAAKGQYIHFLPELVRLLPVGGILLSDNVLQEGDIIESRYVVARRDRTIHSRMREYLYELKHSSQFNTSIIPIGDGASLSIRC